MGYDMSTVEGNRFFRLNVFGMGQYKEAMHALGMLHWSTGPGYNEWPDLGGNPTEQQWRKHAEACLPVLRDHRGGPPGIPSHKLSSNDGWIVTPEECTAAVQAYERATKGQVHQALNESVATEREDDRGMATARLVLDKLTQAGAHYEEKPDPPIEDTYWNEWIDYLRTAAKHGGFRVY